MDCVIASDQQLSESIKENLLTDVSCIKNKSFFTITRKKRGAKVTKPREMINDVETFGRVLNCYINIYIYISYSNWVEGICVDD